MRKHLFPEAIDAYRGWASGQDREALHRLADSGARRWMDAAQTLLGLYQMHGDQAGPVIENLLEPAGETPPSCAPKSASSS